MSRPVIVIGAGGHGKVVVETLRASGREILGVVDKDPAWAKQNGIGVKVLGDDQAVLERDPDSVDLANGVGGVVELEIRQRIYNTWGERGYRFASVMHPAAVVSAGVRVDSGAQVMAGVVMQPGARVGENSLINTRASVDHDCRVGRNVHVGPGVTLCGAVVVEDGVFVGAGATVIQGIRIGAGAMIGAGAVVVSDIGPGIKARGVPARRAVN